MIVTITSCAPVRALSRPAMPAQSAPPMRPPRRATSMWMPHGRSNPKPTQPATAAAMSIWPRPPMLNMPTRNARPTPRPAAMSGVAKVSVSVSGRMPDDEVVAPEVVDRALEQGRVGAGHRLPDRGERVAGAGEEVAAGLLHALVGERDHDGADEEREHHGEHRDDRVAGGDLVEHRVPARRRRHVGGGAGPPAVARASSAAVPASGETAPGSSIATSASSSGFDPPVEPAAGCWGSLMRRLLLRGVRRPS